MSRKSSSNDASKKESRLKNSTKVSVSSKSNKKKPIAQVNESKDMTEGKEKNMDKKESAI